MAEQPFRGIARELERRIREGLYPAESALPSRLTLMGEFKVARATLDRAIRELMERGILTGKHGSGTYVRGVDRRRVAVVGGVDPEEIAGAPFDLTVLAPSEVAERSGWNRLYEFDGVLWVRPEPRLWPVIERVAQTLPQVLVNRVRPGFAYVSTDHRGAYYEITRERLALLPEATPVFLTDGGPGRSSPVFDYRFEGFVDACREAGRFYEVLPLPETFAARVALLEERFPTGEGRGPLLLVSGFRAVTGAVMRWAAERRFEWRKDIYYSDFDNEYPEEVWGVCVTSFVQDPSRLFREASAKLLALLEGGETASGTVLMPQRRNGDT